MSIASDEWMVAVARRLGALVDEVVFVGGAILGALIDDIGAAGVRPTDDLDVIVDARSQLAYDAFGRKLMRLGFHPDTSEDAPLCRWRVDDILVDVMPTHGQILGFTNRWYADAMVHAVRRELEPGLHVRVATAPYFVAMKLEAFASRGSGDFAASHDMEDIIAVVDGNQALVDEIERAVPALGDYLAERIGSLLDDGDFIASISGHLTGDIASQARRPFVLDRLRQIARR